MLKDPDTEKYVHVNFFIFRAPNGCLQYFMGIKNTVTSFNYGAGAGDCNPNCYLQTQDYNVCFKAETGSYKIHKLRVLFIFLFN